MRKLIVFWLCVAIVLFSAFANAQYERPYVRTQELWIGGTQVTATAAELNTLDGITASYSELNVLDGVTAGSVTASKGVVVDSNKDIGDFRNLDAVNIDAGASGTNGSVDIYPATANKGMFTLNCDNQDGDTIVILKPAPMGQACVVSIPDPGATTANVLLTSAANDRAVVTATATELNAFDVSAMGGVMKVKKLPLTRVATTDEQNTTWALPALAMVVDVFINVTTAESTGGTKTVDIGTDGSGSNDPDGFADALSVAATGIVRPQAALTAGGSETYFSANTRGVLLSDFLAGSDTATDVGTYREKPDGTSGGDYITYTLGSADFAELVADVYIVYIELN